MVHRYWHRAADEQCFAHRPDARREGALHSFWEARNRPRTIDYPFTVIQMEIDKNGRGKGTMSYATRIIPAGDTIVLENFATQPVMLTEIKSESHT